MCHYCGCRHIRLIRDYIAEHERVTEHGDHAVRALDRGDVEAATAHVDAMAEELRTHWQGEEKGVFALMIDDPTYREHIEPLIAEHRELEVILRSLDLSRAADQAVLREQVIELGVHIAKEEDGIFPATLVEFSGAEWDQAIAAWQAAHPGQELIAD
ncbi:MAG: hemerythrin domain-containing protein [Nocardioides sp.]